MEEAFSQETQQQQDQPSGWDWKRFLLPVVAVVTVGILLAFAFNNNFFQGSVSELNRTLPNVPYHGVYDGFFYEVPSQVSTARMILEYYGDERFSVRNLLEDQFYAETVMYDVDGYVSDVEEYGHERFASFFRDAGYEVAADAPDVFILDYIRHFIQSNQNIPVGVSLEIDGEENTFVNEWSLVIGIHDNTREVVVHDFLYGNNYRISYEEFLNRYVDGSAFAVWPSEELLAQGTLTPKAYSYPERITAMYIAPPIFAKRIQALSPQQDTMSDVALLDLWEGIVSDQRFEDLHPGYQLSVYTNLVEVLFRLERYEALQEIIQSKMMPINHDLEADYDGWQIELSEAYPTLQEQSFGSLNVMLANAMYLSGGSVAQARQLFEETLAMHPGYLEEAPPFRVLFPVFQED